MQQSEFIAKIEEEFEDIERGSLKSETEFRKLEGWNSMMALIVIAKIDAEYNVTITAEELAKCTTLQDLYNSVDNKIAGAA